MADSAKAKLCYVDVDNDKMEAVCQKHGVSAMPTLVYIKDGKEAGKMEGVDSAKLATWVDCSA